MADRPDVLICDDSLLIRKQLRDILEKTCGLQVVEADNGVNAVEVFRQHWPKIVILDIVLREIPFAQRWFSFPGSM
ncbi:MAG TPA: response regulator, partial [Synergistaceae bacterium]|nr:response regulator [Synergistaceae bacterium]